MKHYFFIYSFTIFILSSCSIINKEFIVRHKTKKIKLTGISDSIKIGYITDSAIVYFSLIDMIKLTEDILNNGKLEPIWDYLAIDELKENLKLLNNVQKDLNVNHLIGSLDSSDINLYKFSGFIDQWIFKNLIFEKKAEVWNKLDERYEKTVIYHFVRNRLGGESCYYTFRNGKEFYRQVIALGE